MPDDLKVAPVAVSEWDASLADIVTDMHGKPIHVHSLMANHPKLLKAWWSFRNYSVEGGDLGRRKGELVILRVAVHMRAWYEWGSHVERALACGIALEEIERVKQPEPGPEWDESEALLLRAVDELIATYRLSPESHVKLREHYSVRQLMDIMAIHGMYVILGCMINTWGLELDAHVKAKLPESVTKEQFESEIKARSK